MKKLLLITIAAFGLCLAACSGGSAPKPSGDPAKDAKALLEYTIEQMNSIKDEATANDFQKQMEEMEKSFEEAYKDADAKAKFEEEGKKLAESPEYKKKLEEATNHMMEVALKALAK